MTTEQITAITTAINANLDAESLTTPHWHYCGGVYPHPLMAHEAYDEAACIGIEQGIQTRMITCSKCELYRKEI